MNNTASTKPAITVTVGGVTYARIENKGARLVEVDPVDGHYEMPLSTLK